MSIGSATGAQGLIWVVPFVIALVAGCGASEDPNSETARADSVVIERPSEPELTETPIPSLPERASPEIDNEESRTGPSDESGLDSEALQVDAEIRFRDLWLRLDPLEQEDLCMEYRTLRADTIEAATQYMLRPGGYTRSQMWPEAEKLLDAYC